MARTNSWTETMVDWVDGRLRQNRFSNLWLGGGAGTHGGSSYRPIDGQLTQRHVCYDTSEEASPCSPSGFSSLVDNLRRIRYWQEPATWFGVTTSGAPASGSYLNVYIKPGLWYPSTTEYCAFTGGDSPTFTLPSVLDRIDTVYIDPNGVLHIQHGTPAASPTITLPPIASGIPLWAVHLTPTSSGITHIECSGYYAGMGYIERDLRPFLNLGGGGTAASGVPGSVPGAILRGVAAGWQTYNIGAANEVLTNDGTNVLWSTGAINLTAGKTLTVNADITLDGVDGKSLVLINGLTVEGGNEGILHFDAAASITIEANSILNQDLTTDASVTFADVFVPDGGTFGISGNELLTVNAAGNFTFSGITSIVVPDGTWLGIGAAAERIVFDAAGDISVMGAKFGVGTLTPGVPMEIADVLPAVRLNDTNATTANETVAYFEYGKSSGGWVRYAYLGFASAATDDFSLENESPGGNVILQPTSGNVGIGTVPGGTLDIAGEIRITADDAFAAGVAQLYTDATNGLIITGHAGTTYDLLITEASGAGLFANPQGTTNVILCVSAGRVGIGVSPSYELDVKDDAAGGFVAHFFNDGDNINRYGIHVQAGADNGAAVGSTFYFYATDGDGNSTGNLLTINGVFQLQDVSDKDRKTKIKNTKIVGLDIINGLQVRDYNWKANPKGPVMTSFVAQEAQKVFPAMIAEAPDGTLMTARAMLIPVLTKAIQELDARLTRLENY